jgi:predicted amidohydrolase
MQIQAMIAQFPVSWNIAANMASIQALLEQAAEDSLVLFPEGGLSGYSDETAFYAGLDDTALSSALDQLKRIAQQCSLHLWVGACYRQQGRWYNAAWGFTPQGQTHIYHKVNLATAERGMVTGGMQLPVFELEFPQGSVRVGVQICRELRYPEQWGWLARQGAQVLLHLNNATGSDAEQPVWRSHLVSRAAETQRFVLSANNAAARQKCPTLAIAPRGLILDEVISDQPHALRVDLDLDQVSDWYLSQSRTDVVKIISTSWLDEMDN